MSRRRTRFRLATPIAAVLVATSLASALGGCATAEPALPDGVVASVKQGRLDIAARRLVVRLENGSDRALSISRLELDAPTLAEPIVRTEPFELAAGDAIDLRFDLPAAVCDESADDAATSTATVSVAFTSGRADGAGGGSGSDAAAGTAELPVADPFETLPRIHDDECFAALVAERAELRLVEPLRVEGSGAEQRAVVEIAVEPHETDASGALVVERVLSSTLLSAEAGAATGADARDVVAAEDDGNWLVNREIAGGEAPFVIELPVRPARCDAHAIADDKRGTIFRLEIRDGDREGLVELVSSPELKAALYAYYGERCGL
ncbi:hypothetical protein ACWKWP_07005 [Agromyces soli]